MANETLRLLSQHRSIRKYTQGELDSGMIMKCVQAAQMAATSSNVQGYSLLQVRNEEQRRALVQLTGGQAQVAEAGAFFLVCADQMRHRLMAEEQGRAYEANLETFLVGAIDASLFAQNLVIGFESEDLGTCFIGGLRNDLRAVRELLAIPKDVFPLYGLCVGAIKEDSECKPRLAGPSVLFVDNYPDADQARSQIAEYDGRMAKYYAQRDLPGRNWSGGVARKFELPRREELIAFYEEQGARWR